MSIGGFTVGEAALAEQPSEPSKKTPPKRKPSPRPIRPFSRNRAEPATNPAN